MSRHENDDISEFNIPDKTKMEELYDTSGKSKEEPPLACAKKTFYPETGRTQFYALCSGGQLFNPKMTNDVRYSKRNHWKMRKVKESVFKCYIRYLKEKREVYLHQAEREI